MRSSLVSLRLPSEMVEALRQLAHDHHYADVSELARSVLRKRYLQEKNTLSFEISKLTEEVKKHLAMKQDESLVLSLQKLVEELKR